MCLQSRKILNGLVEDYGAAQVEKKTEFLAEFARIDEDGPFPMLVGGDFNIIRRK
jgi:hypothetical protein